MSKLENYNLISNIVGKENVLIDESMAKHTTLKIGGSADLFVKVNNLKQLRKILEINLGEPITVIGNGSNLLVKDNGIRGIVIKYNAHDIQINGNTVIVESGVMNGVLAKKLVDEELSGYEFASGIPGTIGGAIFMNAGAYGMEIADVIEKVSYIDLTDNNIYTINKEQCEFEYRNSIFTRKKSIILNAQIKTESRDKKKIQDKMDEYMKKRLNTQPIEKPSAGSSFKRGSDFIPAQLIDEAGLKGYRIGGAEISTKHAGFIINNGNATAQNVLELVETVKEKIYEKYKKELILEMRVIGE